MLFRRLNKKGDIREVPATQLMGTVLGAFAIILVFTFAGAFAILYFGEKDDEFATNNFIALANKIETLSKSRGQFDVQRAFPFYLPSKFVVVGFNKGWVDSKISDGCEPEAVRKPTEEIGGKEGKKCEGSACICLFGDSNYDFMDENEYNVELMECRSLPKVDYIIIPHMKENDKYPSEISKNFIGEKIHFNPSDDYSSIGFSDYAFSYIYGQCDDYFWGTNLQSRKLYIEKFTDNTTTYIFVTPEHEESNFANERFTAMNEKYGESS